MPLPHDVCIWQMLHNLLHTNIQPWFKADVQAILGEPDIATMRSGKYVGLHIRRTDKANEVQPVKTKVQCFSRHCKGAHTEALLYLFTGRVQA